MDEDQITILFETCDYLQSFDITISNKVSLAQRKEQLDDLIEARAIIQSLKRQVYSGDLIQWLTQLENKYSSCITSTVRALQVGNNAQNTLH
ncbi:MAG: hypothetical protein KAS23_10505 [Anaerohalosphaera sp.]|nr:hypothetical protein [Anaerohalosphaera sp.]